LEHTLDDMVDDEMKGQGTEYTFGEDVIPLSMGGRKPFTPPSSSSRYQDFFPAAESWLNGETNDVELEMTGRAVNRSLSGNNGGLEHARSNGSINRMGGDESLHHSYHSDDDRDSTGAVSSDDMKGRLKDDMPLRLARDPDLVDLPDLRRTSKVAVPVSSLAEGDRGGHLA
jgi:hypothetical protein